MATVLRIISHLDLLTSMTLGNFKYMFEIFFPKYNQPPCEYNVSTILIQLQDGLIKLTMP